MLAFSQDPRVAEEQMHAVIFYLTAFGYIDGDFDQDEKTFVKDYIGRLVSERAAQAQLDAASQKDVVVKWTAHFHEVFQEIDARILEYFDEPVADGENQRDFVLAKLKLRAYELFKQFDDENRKVLLGTVDELMHADGVVHPNEVRFRDDVAALLAEPIELDDAEIEEIKAGDVLISPTKDKIAPREENHPWFQKSEWNYGSDRDTVTQQAAEDVALIRRVRAKFDEQRAAGRGKLVGKQDVSELWSEGAYLDGHVYVLPPKPGPGVELIVLGDLHGCYSCLKATLLQSDFFAKVERFHADPANNPDVKLVLLGDYIDRGKFSYNGILRTVMNLFLTVPDHVYMLRGNHEYYVQLNGRVYGGVKPAEAINSLQGLAPEEVFEEYMRLFEDLPNMLLMERMLFVHAGIPRDDTLAKKWLDLASLNDPDIRFQMLWSDPSEAEFIPADLQKANARFPFGRRQFKSFMSRVGATTMVRGHERIVEGFKVVYEDEGARLLNLFSAGGKNNADLPPNSNYREVIPMALSITHKGGITQMTPFVIDYERYNDPKYNAFFK